MSEVLRKCDTCGKEYKADSRALNRGWGLTCSKSCAAKKREMSKPGYDPKRVIQNNYIRDTWVDDHRDFDDEDDDDAMEALGMDFLLECGSWGDD